MGPALMGLVAAAMTIVALTACTNGDAVAGPDPTPSPVSTVTPAPVAPSLSPEPSPSEMELTSPPPEVDLVATSEADLERVVSEILAFRDWLFANPHQDFRINQIYLSQCPCSTNFAQQLASIADAERRAVALGSADVQQVSVVDRSPRSVTILVKWRPAPVEIRNSQGEAVAGSAEYGPVHDETWIFDIGSNGLHRIAAVGAN